MGRLGAIILCLVATGIVTVGGDLGSQVLEIGGAKISDEEDATRIAADAYGEKMGVNIWPTERVRVVCVVTVGYDMAGFAKRGDRIWEARSMTIDEQVRAIMWINSETGMIRFLCGPWEEDSSK